jgi:hypothetical protein
MSNLAFYFIVPAMIFKAPATIKLGIFEFCLHKSYIKAFRLLNGESNIAADMCYDLLRYNSPATAPIDLPHRAIEVTSGLPRMYSTT